MSERVTLVHDELNPSPVVVDDPGLRTQLISLGYRVVDPDEAPPTGYAALSKADLVEEVRVRNEQREANGQEPIPSSGTKQELIAALEADDSAVPAVSDGTAPQEG